MGLGEAGTGQCLDRFVGVEGNGWHQGPPVATIARAACGVHLPASGSELTPSASGWQGDWLKLQQQLGRRRRACGLSQGAAGALIGVSAAKIKRFESQGRDLPSCDLFAYAASLGLRLVAVECRPTLEPSAGTAEGIGATP
ncbi:MAG: helix-turn-helix domain-containing protein [Azospirillum sp.]|nr:helix-turn-helix domain-containing protein [Azospirillum sp.]